MEHAVILFLVGKDSWCFIIKRSWNRGQCAYKGKNKFHSYIFRLYVMSMLKLNIKTVCSLMQLKRHLLKQTRNNMFSIF